jgi:hypothetical protein
MLDEPQPWPGILELIGLLLVLALGLVGLSGAVWLMIWPVERRARATQGKFRFRLIDLGCLLVYWQVILAAITTAKRDNLELMLTALAVFGVPACGVIAVIWGNCVGVLSRAGIESSACRAAFILVSVPGATVASVAFVTSGIAMLMRVYFQFSDPSLAFPFWAPAMGFVVSSGAIFLLRLLSLRIAADARS